MNKITDGTSHTALFSESLLGNPDGSPLLRDVQLDYKFTLSAPLTDDRCSSTLQWNLQNGRGFAWVSGEMQCACTTTTTGPTSRSRIAWVARSATSK